MLHLIIRFFLEAGRWQVVRDSGVYLYQQNKATGRRRVVQYGSGFQPVDWGWVDEG